MTSDQIKSLLEYLASHASAIPRHRRAHALVLIERVAGLVPDPNPRPQLQVEAAIPIAAKEPVAPQREVKSLPTATTTNIRGTNGHPQTPSSEAPTARTPQPAQPASSQVGYHRGRSNPYDRERMPLGVCAMPSHRIWGPYDG